MAEENTRRRDVATATTGAVLLGGGGTMRHAAVRRAYPGKAPKIHALSMLRKAPKGKRLFWGGSTVGLLGLPPLAVGTSNLAHGSHGQVDKADYSAFWAGHRLGRKMPAPRPKIVHLRHDNGKFACGAKHVPMMSTSVVTDRAGRSFTGMKRNANPTSSSKYAHNVTCPTCKTVAGDSEAARTLERSRLQAVLDGNSERAREKRTGQHRGLQAIQRNINKAADEKRKGFWREGLSGTREALGQRAESYKEPVPAKLRAAQLGVGAGAGALGSLAARAALGRRGNALKPLLTPVAGGLAATASVPLSNHYVSHRHPDYEITPTGVRRKKTPVVMPSKKSSRYQPMPRSFRQDLSKAETKSQTKYRGAATPYGTQRAAITAATHTPVIGPFAGSAAAGRYAPPGQGRKQAVRQYAMSSGVALPAGVAGAYGGAALANRSDRAHRAASKLVETKHKVEHKARTAVGMGEKKPGRVARAGARFTETKAGKPFRTPKGAIGGMAGFMAARAVVGGIGDQAAISLNQRDQRRYNTAHHIEKSEITPGVFRSITSTGPGHRELIRARVRHSKGQRLSGIGPRQRSRRSLALNQSVRGVFDAARQPTVPSEVHRNVHYGADVSAAHRDVLDRAIGSRRIKRPVSIHVTEEAEAGGGGMATATPGRMRNLMLISPRMLQPSGQHTGPTGLHHTLHHELTHAEKRKPGWVTPRSLRESRTGDNPAGLREEARADEASYQWHGITRVGHGEHGQVDRQFRGMQRKLRAQRGTRGRVPIPMGRGQVEKFDQTKRERADLARQKRRSAALSTMSGTAGLGSLVLLAAGKRQPAVTLGTIGAGVGGTNSLLGAKVQRKEAQVVDPVKKGLVPGTREWFLPKQGVVRSAGRWLSVYKDRENPVQGTFYVDPDDMEVFRWTRDRSKAHRSRPGNWTTIARTKDARAVYESRRRNTIAKASALTIQGSKQEHAEMLRRYGDRGSLPKNLSRDERMKAYEARYVHHGGDKANRWSRRANVGEGLKNVGLGVGTAGGAAWLATRGKRGAKLLAKHPKLRSHAETTAVAGATLGGAGEMLAGYAHRRQSSYANSPGGVAASALRRMRAYTPEDQ